MKVKSKSKTKKDSQIKFYKLMTSSVLMYGSEHWALGRCEGRKIETAEMRILRPVSSYIQKPCTQIQYTMYF